MTCYIISQNLRTKKFELDMIFCYIIIHTFQLYDTFYQHSTNSNSQYTTTLEAFQEISSRVQFDFCVFEKSMKKKHSTHFVCVKMR